MLGNILNSHMAKTDHKDQKDKALRHAIVDFGRWYSPHLSMWVVSAGTEKSENCEWMLNNVFAWHSCLFVPWCLTRCHNMVYTLTLRTCLHSEIYQMCLPIRCFFIFGIWQNLTGRLHGFCRQWSSPFDWWRECISWHSRVGSSQRSLGKARGVRGTQSSLGRFRHLLPLVRLVWLQPRLNFGNVKWEYRSFGSTGGNEHHYLCCNRRHFCLLDPGIHH